MKSFYSLLMGAALIASSATCLQAEEMYLGYCDGVVSNESASVSGKNIHCAICLPASDLQRYEGKSLSRIRVGVNTDCKKLPSYVTVWVRLSQDGDNLVQKKSAVVTGWNDIAFDEPLTIPAGTDLWVGYTYPQSSTKYTVMSYTGEAVEGYSFWLNTGSLAGWVDHSDDYGALSLEAVVEGEQLPHYDLSLLSYATTRSKTRLGSDITLKGTVKNCATQPAEGYVVSYSVNQGALTGEYTSNTTLSYRQKEDFSLTIPTEGLAEGAAYIDFEVKWLGDIADEYPSDNVGSCSVALYTNGFDRTTLLEEFTTEVCPNCPYGIYRINQALNKYDLRDQVIWVCHHNGYYTDFLTTDESYSYCQLFGTSGYTFAPAMMVDRTYNANYVDDSGYYVGGVVGSIGYDYQVAAWINEALAEPAFAGVEITSAYIDGDVIRIHVKGEKLDALDGMTSDARLNVWIKENHIPMRNQGDNSGLSTGYHEHAFRASMTGVWGESITWDGKTFERDLTCTLSSDWNVEQLECVAFISRYSATNRRAREVFNADQCAVSTTAGIHAVQSENAEEVRFMDLNGRPLSGNAHGIVLEQTTAADGTVTYRKVMVE